MKKTRKLLALLMALAMTMTVFAFPASAATKPEELVSPQAEVLQCISCNGAAEIIVVEDESAITWENRLECDMAGPTGHIHEIHTYYEYLTCRNCGNTLIDSWKVEVCPDK